jgi:hypothetical protein
MSNGSQKLWNLLNHNYKLYSYKMSISNNKGVRRKLGLALSSTDSANTSAFIILALMLLAGGGFFVLISPTIVSATPSDTITTTTTTAASGSSTSSPLGTELSPQPVYQEQEKLESQILINQTHFQVIVSGNGTLTLPNGTETIRTTSTKSGIVSIMEGAFTGKEEIFTTEDDASENATATVYEIVRFNFETGEGRGIAIAHVHTDSTGRLAPLDGMILAGHDELHPDGTGLLTLWEWQSGIPYLEMQAQPPMMQESSMNRTTTAEPSPPTVMQ